MNERAAGPRGRPTETPDARAVRDFPGAVSLPYILIESPGADRLVWAFPKLKLGGAKPPRNAPDHYEGLGMHMLLIGCDPGVFVGPRRSMRGQATALELHTTVCRDLGVPAARNVAVGTSMGAVCALFLGLTAGCGHVIAGAPPVTMGRMLRRFAKLDGPSNQTKAAANDFLALADNGTDDPATFLDELIPRLRTPSRPRLASTCL
jgi:hypothetical protein